MASFLARLTSTDDRVVIGLAAVIMVFGIVGFISRRRQRARER